MTWMKYKRDRVLLDSFEKAVLSSAEERAAWVLLHEDATRAALIAWVSEVEPFKGPDPFYYMQARLNAAEKAVRILRAKYENRGLVIRELSSDRIRLRERAEAAERHAGACLESDK